MQTHNVPFYSQYKHIPLANWKNRGCGVTALKMLMDFWHTKDNKNKTAPLKELVQKRTAGSFVNNVGWTHAGLVSMARKYGYEGFNKDLAFLKMSPQQAFGNLKKDLERFPIMASVWNGFDPIRKGGHLVVITGVTGGLIYLNDPEEKSEKLGRKAIRQKRFIKAFKKRYLAIYPSGTISRLEKMRIFNIDIVGSYLAMIQNSPGTKMFRNLYINLPSGKTDILKNGDLSCSVFVSSILYWWGLIADTHANVDSTIKDMLDSDWQKIKKPLPGCVIEWEPKLINGGVNKHVGFYIGKNKAISNRFEKGTPLVHHWTYGNKGGKPVRKIINMYYNYKLKI